MKKLLLFGAAAVVAVSSLMAQSLFDPTAKKAAEPVKNECCVKNEACCNPPQECCNQAQNCPQQQNCCKQQPECQPDSCAVQTCPVQNCN